MHGDTVVRRLRRLVDESMLPALEAGSLELPVQAWSAPGEPVSWREAVTQPFRPTDGGEPWGRAWGTTWFRVRLDDIPVMPSGADFDVVVDIGFDHTRPGFQCEATVWDEQGRIIKALEPMNQTIPLTRDSLRGSLFVEASSNPNILFAGGVSEEDNLSNSPTPFGDVLTAPDGPLYTFRGARLRERRPEAASLLSDIRALEGLLRILPDASRRRARIVEALRDLLRVVDPAAPLADVPAARATLESVLAQPASASAAELHAVGHAHIDSAWLWPVRETRRKVARTFANALSLMDEDEEFRFVASSAQQYAWVQEDHPELFERVRERVAEGRFIPVGGMWVEADTNLPSGESLARQLIEGTRYFIDEFGIESDELWLPDSFGYSGSVPQIARAAGKKFAVVQKISWNDTNRMPASTFTWEGIDGSRLLAHLPSVDIYNTDLRAEDLLRAESQLKPAGTLSHTLVPFGYGDGGGGPTGEMLSMARRVRDLEGLPRTVHSTPAAFFEAAGREVGELEWVGELYLEFHRGTYTSQRAMKSGNHLAEHLLREAEHAAAAAAVRAGAEYPYEQFRRLWRSLLLLQFHDILPGTSIAWVHREAREMHAAIAAELRDIQATALCSLPDAVDPDAVTATRDARPRIRVVDDGHEISNEHMTVIVDSRGLIVSLRSLAGGPEIVPEGGSIAQLHLFADVPADYDAWEIDKDFGLTQVPIGGVEAISVLEHSERVGIEVVRKHGSSTYTQRYTLEPDAVAVEIETIVDWQEDRKLLKLAFDLDRKAESLVFGTQFGHLERPVTRNTSWESARFEVPAHGFVRVGQGIEAVAVCGAAIFGHDVRRKEGRAGGALTIRQSLLRAPVFPDPRADRGRHVFRSSLAVVADVPAVRAEVLRLDSADFTPVPRSSSLAFEDEGRIAISAVKLADDGSGDVIVRLHEAQGSRSRTKLRLGFGAAAAIRTDLLERALESDSLEVVESAIDLDLRPFELVTLRFTPLDREGLR